MTYTIFLYLYLLEIKFYQVKTIFREAEKICKQEVLRRSLVKTTQGSAPERSKGRVAFVLRTQ
jgi:hypothetical protein